MFIIIYLVVLFSYLFTRFNDNIKYRAINKYILATMYLVFAFVAFFRKYEIFSFHILIIIALLFTYLGDIFLVFNYFKGGIFFSIANIFFIIYEHIILFNNGYTFKDIFWVYIVVGIMISSFVLLCKYKADVFKLGKMKWPMSLYLFLIFFNGILGLSLLILLPNTNYVILGIGALLFMFSDMILTAYKYVFNNNILLIRANSISYFIGLLLIVLSIV